MSTLQRVMAIIMTVVTVCFGGLWALGYMYLTAMACAFGSATGRCSSQAVWNLSGEDLQYMVLIPGVIFLVLLTVTVLLWRSKSEPVD
ncbi:MAG: hypothetical protein ABJN34_15310 [Litoreibacter sp.]|uniref:hypothetical protein n=1 Tax=Litoreibacter sp. TaxID=1969459 RepID=UPI0032980DC8